jgi:ATP-dependent Zn protease
MFVGVGAKRVRELFAEAKAHKPCIIFIDEIDTLLSKSRRFASEHSSSRATINQLLAEMDGFEKNDNILVIGATNHADILDPAAIRPGRFDKKIHVPLPDINGRE